MSVECALGMRSAPAAAKELSGFGTGTNTGCRRGHGHHLALHVAHPGRISAFNYFTDIIVVCIKG